MGLIKLGIMGAGAWAVTHELRKGYETRNQDQQPQHGPYPPQQQMQGYRDVNAPMYGHQTWCNGQCGGHCE